MLPTPAPSTLDLAAQSLDMPNWVEEAECSCLQQAHSSCSSSKWEGELKVMSCTGDGSEGPFF